MTGKAARPARWAVALLWAAIVAYTLFFSAVSIRMHSAHRTHLADLGQIDQAIWNTSQGRFGQEIKGDQISTRLTDHVEPLFAPLSLIFWLWDDVRALLVLQSALLALGAWPVFLIAHDRLASAAAGRRRQRSREQPAGRRIPSPDLTTACALAFALVYLLYPPLQAANVAEFHALPLATPLILCAFLCAGRRQWGRFALAALLVATVQEGAALLSAALGLYALALGLRTPQERQQTRRAPLIVGIVVLLAGLAWFYAATFVIIPAYAASVYGLTETPYAARYGALGDSFGAVLVTLLTRPGTVLAVALEPLRRRYLLQLLAPAGFLALLAPEILLLGLPLLLANLLSAFPFQYSGQLHYSAPLAAYALTGGILGAQRLSRLLRRTGALLRSRPLMRTARSGLLLLVWLAVWGLGSQIAGGYAPIGPQFRFYWPAVTDHHRLLTRFAAQIPPDAPLSTMPTLHPHLSHRQRIYQFPVVADSDYALLDIAARSGWAVHPEMLRDQVSQLLQSGVWAVQDAADGYLLLRRTPQGVQPTTIEQLPGAFFSFARSDAQPQHPLDMAFAPPGADPAGGRLRLVGYDVLDDPQWRQTAFRFYWQALGPLPKDLRLRVFFLAADGREVDSSDQRPLIQPLWHPPSAWRARSAESAAWVVTDKLAWHLPRQWAVAVGVQQGQDWSATDTRWRVVGSQAAAAPGALAEPVLFEDRTWVRLAAWERRTPPGPLPRPSRLVTPPSSPRFAAQELVFGGDGWTVALTGVAEPVRSAPGQSAPLTLRWQAERAAPRDYTVFVHLRDENDRTVAQADATPHRYGPLPTSRWPARQTIFDTHTFSLPSSLPPGVYRVVVGWYYWETQERLALLGPEGQPIGDGATVATLEVDATAGPQPDLCCALTPECCASQQ